MDQDSEIQRVEAAKQGCVESFGVLYEQYHGTMVAIAYALLGQRDLAEDVAQEVFVIACQDLAKLKRADRFGPWLAGICRNLARRLIRSQGRMTCVSMAFDVQARESDDSHQLDMLRDALDTLKPGERELIVLRYHDNLPYERIGSVLNISTRAVNSRLIRTKQKLAKHFKQKRLNGENHDTAKQRRMA
jgi:RNA polymerase sigma factor (sigma-70 family)